MFSQKTWWLHLPTFRVSEATRHWAAVLQMMISQEKFSYDCQLMCQEVLRTNFLDPTRSNSLSAILKKNKPESFRQTVSKANCSGEECAGWITLAVFTLCLWFPDKPGRWENQTCATEWRRCVWTSQQGKIIGSVVTRLQHAGLFSLTSSHCALIQPQEIARLQEENDKLKARLRTIESQVYIQFLLRQKCAADGLCC